MQTELQLIPIEEITLGERIREDIGRDEWKDLIESISEFGLIIPILVTPSDTGYTIVAGGRRYLAIREIYNNGGEVPGISRGQVPVAIRRELPEYTKLLLEGEENLKRKDFTPIEKAKYIRLFHEKMKKLTAQWTTTNTATAMHLSQSLISTYLQVEDAAKNDESVAKATTLRSAVKRLRVSQELKARVHAAKHEAPDAQERAGNILRLGDSRKEILQVPSESIDFCFFDPPWGEQVSAKASANHESFDDSEEYSVELVATLLPEIYRTLRTNRWLCYWYRPWGYERALAQLTAAGFEYRFTRTPAIWYKPDKNNDQNRYPERKLIDGYETFIFATKGEPVFYDRTANNVFAFDRVPRAQLIHPTEKPVTLCDSIIRLCTVPGETVLDPCAGSSASLEAAIRASRKAVGFELSPNYHERGIDRLVQYLKTLKLL